MKTNQYTNALSAAMKAHHDEGKINRQLKAVVIEPAKTVYLAIPKAANSSAKVALCRTLGIDRDLIKTQSDIHSDLIPTMPAHEAMAMVRPDWFVFTIARHPYHRAYSAWRNKLDRADPPFKPMVSMGLEKGDSFVQFLKVLDSWPRLLLNDHFIPQTDLLMDALPFADLKVFHMESLGPAWDQISDEIESRGVPRPDPIPHVNSSGKVANQLFSPIAIYWMRRLYGRDFGPLGYRKPLFL